MRPGVSVASEGSYRFTTPKGSIYEYTIKNVSESKMTGKDQKDMMILRQNQTRVSTLRRRLLGNFVEPPEDENSWRINVTGEIVRAFEFDAHELYVQYFLDLPVGWKENIAGLEHDDEMLTSITHFASTWGWSHMLTDCFGTTDYNFSFPFEFVFESHSRSVMPKLVMIVHSYDIWERHRVEGYGYVSIPEHAGSYSVDMKMWKPVGTIVSQMRYFFLGNANELEDPRYVGIPSDFDKQVISRYGFKTETSGCLEVTLNVTIQDRQSMIDFHQEKTSQEFQSKMREKLGTTRRSSRTNISGGSDTQSVMDVLAKLREKQSARSSARESRKKR
eukprot:TRINITY_DN2017_c1_g2_i3.p1 TRINITY_DN2017_c1_g2~~TRINITY_DN2017_c1_g2_i3.p1  ORF type:complete len:332 (+),score=79.18 TRINITY_DN2017_c1_g2_i3:205-1200(+)